MSHKRSYGGRVCVRIINELQTVGSYGADSIEGPVEDGRAGHQAGPWLNSEAPVQFLKNFINCPWRFDEASFIFGSDGDECGGSEGGIGEDRAVPVVRGIRASGRNIP